MKSELNLLWARPNCNFTHIPIKFGANKHRGFFISLRERRTVQTCLVFVLSQVCVCDRVRQHLPAHRHLSNGKKREKKRKSERKITRKKGRGKGRSCSVTIFCTLMQGWLKEQEVSLRSWGVSTCCWLYNTQTTISLACCSYSGGKKRKNRNYFTTDGTD